jgi:hypothetical protein
LIPPNLDDLNNFGGFPFSVFAAFSYLLIRYQMFQHFKIIPVFFFFDVSSEKKISGMGKKL